VGFFDGPDGLLTGIALGQLAALVGTLALLRGLLSRRARALAGRGAALALDGAALVWMLAFVPFWLAMARGLREPNSVVFDYPGTLLPAACNGFLLAALVTLAALVAVALVLRTRGWSRLRWARQSLAVLAFAACALALGYWGMLGFSGW
jgi:hypothetical protein